MAAALYLTPQELADRTGFALETVRDWRRYGTGPKFGKFGRRIRYPIAEVEAWEKSRLAAASA